MKLVDYQPVTIYPDVPRMNTQSYVEARDDYVSQLRTVVNPSCSFYQFGEIRTPGVSDLDLMIVCEDKVWGNVLDAAHRLVRTRGIYKFVFMHDPVVIGNSALPHFRHIHTLKNIAHLHGPKNKCLEEGSVDPEIECTGRLLRHVLWSTFMRNAAMDLDGRNIGMRRFLVLLGNMIQSAISVNCLLKVPLALPFTVAEIRNKILMANPCRSEAVSRDTISSIINFLDVAEMQYVNEANDAPIWATAAEANSLFLPPRTLFVARNAASEIAAMRNRFINGIRVVPLPAYQIKIGTAMLNRLSEAMPAYKRYYRVLMSADEESLFQSTHGWVDHIVRFVELENHYCNPSMTTSSIPLPFGVSAGRKSYRDVAITMLRQPALKIILRAAMSAQKIERRLS